MFNMTDKEQKELQAIVDQVQTDQALTITQMFKDIDLFLQTMGKDPVKVFQTYADYLITLTILKQNQKKLTLKLRPSPRARGSNERHLCR